MKLNAIISFLFVVLGSNAFASGEDFYHCAPSDPNNRYSSYEYTLKIVDLPGNPQLYLGDDRWEDCVYIDTIVRGSDEVIPSTKERGRVSCPNDNVNRKYGKGEHFVLQTKYICTLIN